MKLTSLLTLSFLLFLVGCCKKPEPATAATPQTASPAMDTQKLQAEVMQAENELTTALRSGKLNEGVAMHLDHPGYRNIWNGEIKTHEMLQKRIAGGIEKGLKSIDYQVQDRAFHFLSNDAVLETITATETTVLGEQSMTSGLTAISILWQRVDGKWRLGYLHASELPKVE